MFANLPLTLEEAIQFSFREWETAKMAQEDFDAPSVLEPAPSEQCGMSDSNKVYSPTSRWLKLKRTMQTTEGLAKLKSLKKDAQKHAYRIKRKDAHTQPESEERRLQSFIGDLGAAIQSKWVATRECDGNFSNSIPQW